MATDIRYEFDRFDGRPGEPYQEWRIAHLNHCSFIPLDESGSSWADYLLDIDMHGRSRAGRACDTGRNLGH